MNGDGRTPVFTGKPWEAGAPHAPGNLAAGRLLFTSGITARAPDGELIAPGDMRRQAALVVANLKDVLGAGGADVGDIVKLTVYVTSVDDFIEARDVWSPLYARRPASTLVEVARLQHPGMVIEIEVVALATRSSDGITPAMARGGRLVQP